MTLNQHPCVDCWQIQWMGTWAFEAIKKTVRGRFRWFILAITFQAWLSLILCAKNIVFAADLMIDSLNSVHFGWNDDWKSLALGAWSFGFLFGAILALFAYDYLYIRPLLLTAMMTNGLLNVITGAVAKYAGPDGVIIVRFFIGVYSGTLSPFMNIVGVNWQVFLNVFL